MAPATAVVDFVVHSFQIQQALQLIPKQYQPQPQPPSFEHEGYSSRNFTGGDLLGTQPGQSASIAIPVMLELLIICVCIA
jgi:hypothetical protein